jgi:nickel transport protein
MRLIYAGLIAGAMATAAHGTAFAHGVRARAIGNTATVVELYYTDGEVMAYAEVRVFSPDMPDVPFVNGRADRLGRVTFAADRDGIWRIEAQDNQGHKVRTDVTIAAGSAASQHTASGNSWLLWASLFVNIFASASWIATWRSKRMTLHADSVDKIMEGAST